MLNFGARMVGMNYTILCASYRRCVCVCVCVRARARLCERKMNEYECKV